MGGHSPEEIQAEVRKYWVVGMGLFALTVVTVAVSYLDLSPGMAVFVALVVAGVKGSLVAGVFMHLLSEKQAIYGLLITTIFFFLVLMLGPILSRAGHVINVG